MYQSVDRYGPDPGGQAAFYSSHEITVLIWLLYFSKGLSALKKKFKRLIFVLNIY